MGCFCDTRYLDDDCDGIAFRTFEADADGDFSTDPAVTNEADAAAQPPAGFWFPNPTDCDDGDSSSYPGAQEIADDGIDQNCDGQDATVWYYDLDEDDYGRTDTTRVNESASYPYSAPEGGDCNDYNAAVNPGATEIDDNTVDENCDGDAPYTYYEDLDFDNWSTAITFVSNYLSGTPSGYRSSISSPLDCNDSDGSIRPGAPEVADDGIDQNCDGFDLKTWYRDDDGDTWTTTQSTTANSQPSGWATANPLDCQDYDAAVNPGATEIVGTHAAPDYTDDNCDGVNDWEFYQDTDADNWSTADTVVAHRNDGPPTGYMWSLSSPVDCNDADAAVNPGAFDIPGNGVDDDCDGAAPQPNGYPSDAVTSADGRYVAYSGQFYDPTASNYFFEVYWYDRDTAELRLLSATPGGQQANGASQRPAISPDGQFVTFYSGASNLVAVDTNGRDDVFLYNVQAASLQLVSLNDADEQGEYGDSNWSIPSPDGTRVAFFTYATNMDGSTNQGVFLRDLVAGTTTRITNSNSLPFFFSADGNELVYGYQAYYVVDLTTMVSTLICNGSACGYNTRFASDWENIAFSSSSALVPGDTNTYDDIFVRNLATSATTRISVSSAGAQANGWSNSPSISGDGRYVVFTSQATNLVAGDTNGSVDLFLHDTLDASTIRISMGTGGAEANGGSEAPRFSSDGALHRVRVVRIESGLGRHERPP